MVFILDRNSLKCYILTNFHLKNSNKNAKYFIKIIRYAPKIIAHNFFLDYFYVTMPGQVIEQISLKFFLSSWRGIDQLAYRNGTA